MNRLSNKTVSWIWLANSFMLGSILTMILCTFLILDQRKEEERKSTYVNTIRVLTADKDTAVITVGPHKVEIIKKK